MINPEIDVHELGKSIQKWSKRFGDTNEEALARFGKDVTLTLASKTQPFGIGTKARQKIEKAIRVDTLKSFASVMDRDVWNDIVSGKVKAIPVGGKWRSFNQGQVCRSAAEVDRWVESHRRAGRVPKGVQWRDRGIAWHQDVTDTAKRRSRLAGIAKGAWIRAGADISRKIGKKGLSVGRSGKWARNAAEGAGVRGYVDAIKSLFNPQLKITNEARHTRSSRVLRTRDIRNALNAGAKKTIRYYERAVEAMDKRK